VIDVAPAEAPAQRRPPFPPLPRGGGSPRHAARSQRSPRLLAGSLVGAREAGYTSASLGVDTDSPTGANSLYQSLGFAPEKTFVTYRKPMTR
jgi:hypothetical protein